MSSTKHELCRLEHVCLESDLSLVSTCTLKFSSVKSFPFHVFKSDQLFESFSTAAAWITGSNGVRLTLRLLGQDPCISSDNGLATMEFQAMIVRNLEVAVLSMIPTLC